MRRKGTKKKSCQEDIHEMHTITPGTSTEMPPVKHSPLSDSALSSHSTAMPYTANVFSSDSHEECNDTTTQQHHDNEFTSSFYRQIKQVSLGILLKSLASLKTNWATKVKNILFKS